MADSFNRDEFVSGYLAEAEEHLQGVGKNLLVLEAAEGRSQPRVVRELFRSLHTLKGLSAMVEIESVVAIAHEMETIVRVADQTAAPLSRQAVGVLLSAVSAMNQRVGSFARREPIPAAPPNLLDALRDLVSTGGTVRRAGARKLSLPEELLVKLSPSEQEQLAEGAARNMRAVRLLFSPSPEKSARGVTVTAVRERIGAIGEIVKVLPSSVAKSVQAPAGLVFELLLLTTAADSELLAAAEAQSAELQLIAVEAEPALPSPEVDEVSSDDGALDGATIRVSVQRLDDAMEGLSALLVTRFRLGRALARLREQGSDVRELAQVLHDQSREIKQLRATITRARMVTLSQLLERVPLLVRGMSASAGKQVQLHTDVGRAELDKGVADRVFPAILHLIRNAIDHGIEPAVQRQQQGKPAVGSIWLTCQERSDNQLELRIRDDGRGIDRARVAAAAGAPHPHDDGELLALITRPGLSTQAVATDRSGRGMGMDIVRRVVVETLGGALTLLTAPGEGTMFTLRVPLSISILDSLSFLCGAQVFVVPLAAVEEIVDLSVTRVLRTPAPKQPGVPISMLRQRDADIPLVPLASFFALAKAEQAQSAVVVRSGDKRAAFAVDRMLSQQEVVVRPLEDPLVKVPGVSATTDLGDGRPTLVLDLMSLTNMFGSGSVGAPS